MKTALVSLCFLLKIVIVVGTLEGYVVGGEEAQIEHFPHSVFVIVQAVKDQNVIAWVCGASVLNQRILLTVAHCLQEDGITEIIARVGHSNKYNGHEYYGELYQIHEKYNAVNLGNDIAIIKVHRDIRMSHKVKRISIMRNPPHAYQAVLAGWGLVNESPTRETDWLKYTTLDVMSRRDCSRYLKNLPSGVLCGGALHSDHFAASGDSGSALFIKGYIGIGIVSYKTSASTSLALYTDVSYFYDWIMETSKNLYCHKV